MVTTYVILIVIVNNVRLLNPETMTKYIALWSELPVIAGFVVFCCKMDC